MSKTETEEQVTATAPVEESPETTAVVKQEKAEVSSPLGADHFDDFDGEITSRDLKFPRLQQVQGMGALKDDFPLGAWVLNRETQLADKNGQVRLTVLKVKKYYQEVTDYDGDGPMGRIFDSTAEAEAAGLRVVPDWDNDLPAEVKDVLEMLVAIRDVDGNGGMDFCHEVDGEKYALAQWVVGSYHSYNAVSPALITRRTFFKKPFASTEWVLGSDIKQLKNKNTTFIPVLTPAQWNSDEFAAWASELVSNLGS